MRGRYTNQKRPIEHFGPMLCSCFFSYSVRRGGLSTASLSTSTTKSDARHKRKDHRGRGVASPAYAMPYPVATSRKPLLGRNTPGPRSARPTGSTASSASGRLRRKVGMVEIRQLANEPWAPVAQGHPGAEVVRCVRVALRGTNERGHQCRRRTRF